jgi:PmbA protein
MTTAPAAATAATTAATPALASKVGPATTDPLALLDDLLQRARRAGADAADAVLFESVSLSYAQRLGRPEKLERSESKDLGLRVLIGKRQAIVSSNDFAAPVLKELVARAVAMARTVPEDEFCGLADPGAIARQFPTLDMNDPVEPAVEVLKGQAAAAEEAARAVPGVTNSEGAEAGWGRSVVAMAASNGFAGRYAGSRRSVSVSVLAGEGTGMERDYDYSSAVYGVDLEDPAVVGRHAGEKAVRRLGPRKAATTRVPVIFAPRVAGSIVGHLAGAINGSAIGRGTSFLKDSMGERLFGAGIDIVDDPHRPRGLRSHPFDGEGLPNSRRAVIEDGVLQTWFLDLRSARKLGLQSTGHASRGTSSPPSPAPTNLYLAAGAATPQALIAETGTGFYVTDLIGFGVNAVTGDYSRGAAGFWIENGELAYPVSEVTIAGHLKAMFRSLTPASDLVFRYGTDAPTLRIDGMTVAGV